MRRFTLLMFAILFLGGCAYASLANAGSSFVPGAERAQTVAADCPVTPPVQDQPPDDPNADSFGFGNWHISADRSLWVGIPPSGVWQTGGEKVVWIRPAGSDLQISGQRLDGNAEPLTASIPCCYPTGFQSTGLYFPTAGCWEVSATAGEAELRFVIEVKDAAASAALPQSGIKPTSPLATSVLRQFCGARTCELRLFDTTTGAATAGYAPLDIGQYATFSTSPDLTQLAVVAYRTNNELRDGQLHLVNLATWQAVTTTLTFDGAYNRPLFTSDNARLLVVTQAERWPASDLVHLVDVASGTLLAETALDFYPMVYAFTPDERGIIFFGMRGADATTSHVALLDATTLEVVWQRSIEGLLNGQLMPEGSRDPRAGVSWQPATVFAPDQAALYVVHADQAQLTTIDFATQQIATRDLTQPVSWIERLLMLTARTAHAKMMNGVSKQAALSPDGTRLYVTGTRYSGAENGEYVQEGLGLQVIDVASGEILHEVDTDAQSLSVEPVSGRIFLHGWANNQAEPYMDEWTTVLDGETLEEIAHLPYAVAVARRLDGTPLLLGTQQLDYQKVELTVLDPQTLEVISTAQESSYDRAWWVVMP